MIAHSRRMKGVSTRLESPAVASNTTVRRWCGFYAGRGCAGWLSMVDSVRESISEYKSYRSVCICRLGLGHNLGVAGLSIWSTALLFW